MRIRHKPLVWVLGVAAVIVAALFVIVGPVQQDPSYHRFADTRPILSTPNGLNVHSNLAFLLAGVWGSWFAWTRRGTYFAAELSPAYRVFFAGLILSAFGSSWYHLDPGNNTLVWDRLSMTIAFAGLFAIVVGEYITLGVSRRVLLPMIVLGAASVAYWYLSESVGAGDLRPYAVIQFLPMILIAAIILLYGKSSDLTPYLYGVLAFYVVAKIFEHFDNDIFAMGLLISGHSLKHLAAAAAALPLIYALQRRGHEEGDAQHRV